MTTFTRPSRIARLVVLACVAAIAGSGCSASTEGPQVSTVTVEKTTPAPSAPAPRKAKRTRPAPAFKSCDANIEVKAATTTCEFAQNVFWHYWTDGQSPSLSVYSPAAGSSLTTSCEVNAGRVVCTTADHGVVRFTQAAVDSYSAEQAATYADSHDLGPAAEPDEPDADSASPDTGEAGEEIPNYDEGRGYRVQCEDGMYSQSGGIQGACSGHGGVMD